MPRFDWETVDHGKKVLYDNEQEAIVHFTFGDERIMDAVCAIANCLAADYERKLNELREELEAQR